MRVPGIRASCRALYGRVGHNRSFRGLNADEERRAEHHYLFFGFQFNRIVIGAVVDASRI